MMRWSPLARALALLGWAATILTLLLWFGWLSTMPYGWGIAIMLCLPLFAAGPGLWKRRGYTYAWCSLLSLAYMALGLMEVFATSVGRTPAMAHLLAAVALFLGCVLYPRLSNREQGPASATAPEDPAPGES